MMPLPISGRTLPRLLAAVLALAAPMAGRAQQQPPSGPSQAQARARQPSVSVPSSAASAAPTSSGGESLPVNYVLSPNDLVQVKVFQEDDMNWTVRVTKDSNVNLPLVGIVNVKEKTAEQLGAVVRDRLHDGYLVHPQVNVSVLEFSKRRFTILGQVEHPGQIDFPDNAGVNVLQAIGMAGGMTKNSGGRAFIKRRVGTREIVLTVDVKRMARDPSLTPFEVLPGDTITVSETLF